MRLTSNNFRHFRSGLGLVEAMVALAITAALLTAVAAAFTAAGAAIDENDTFFAATQGGRVAMARILTQVRRGTPATDSTATNLHLLTDNGLDISYNYDPSTYNLNLVTTTSTILVHNASQCSFAYTLGTDYANNPCVTKVIVNIAITVGHNKVLLNGSASPRRSLTF